jgi:hypothetical protein
LLFVVALIKNNNFSGANRKKVNNLMITNSLFVVALIKEYKFVRDKSNAEIHL